MTGPSVSADPGCLPVRGDLAHIKLAGRYFVPHYAVPMPHRLVAPATLRAATAESAPEICPVPAGAAFDVLDMAGGWAWGQYGEDGPVGYLPLASLEAA
ncbi:SH3 domain-containing protein [Novosphingobium soli]|uniref:SH3 domain-containing protein n=2 Tax=Novosphingobium soli TaxID=574956 RepID=A0ABV6CXX0_9SPHN